MSKKRRDADDFTRDLRAKGKQPTPPDRSHNAPESRDLTPDERTYIEAGRSALTLLRKTFETWIIVGKAIQTLRTKADRIGGRSSFARLLDQQGFGEFIKDKATCTRLLRIMEQLAEVGAWHATLPPKQQLAWCHPSTVFLHCPVFAKPKADKPKKPEAVAQKTITEKEPATLWTQESDAIAQAIVKNLSREKLIAVAKSISALIKTPTPKLYPPGAPQSVAQKPKARRSKSISMRSA